LVIRLMITRGLTTADLEVTQGRRHARWTRRRHT
jgi:hypothetical protein